MNIAAVLRLVVLAALGPTRAAVAGNVLVVDSNGGGGFTGIQTALDVAAEGDTLLVKSGSYASFSVVDKSVSIAADAGHDVHVNGSAQVRSLAFGKSVVLSGLRITGAAGPLTWQGVGLRLKNDVGSVRVEDCVLVGWGRQGALVEGCAGVAFLGCTLQGGDGEPSVPGWKGLEATASSVALYDSLVRGGRGDSADSGGAHCGCTDGGDGGEADEFLFASGGSFEGGAAGNAWSVGCCLPNTLDACDGGNGLIACDVHLLDVATHGGSQGSYDCCNLTCGWDGQDGQDSVSCGTVDVLPGLRRRLSLPGVAREQTNVPVAIDGQPGDTVWLYVAGEPDFEFRPQLRGVHLTPLPPAARLVACGVVPGSGTSNVQLVFPDNGAGVESKVLHLQVVVRSAGGLRFLGSARTLVVLDQAF